MTEPELSFEDFCQRLLSLFDEGRFTATYKYAVLIGLLDVLAERVDRQGRAPTVVHTLVMHHTAYGWLFVGQQGDERWAPDMT